MVGILSAPCRADGRGDESTTRRKRLSRSYPQNIMRVVSLITVGKVEKDWQRVVDLSSEVRILRSRLLQVSKRSYPLDENIALV